MMKQWVRNCRISGTIAQQRLGLRLRGVERLREVCLHQHLGYRPSLMRLHGQRGPRVPRVLRDHRDLDVPVDLVTLIDPGRFQGSERVMEGEREMRE